MLRWLRKLLFIYPVEEMKYLLVEYCIKRRIINKTQKENQMNCCPRVFGRDYYAKAQNRAHCTKELCKINEHLMNGKQMKSGFFSSVC